MADNPKSRGTNFSSTELNQLCASWMHILQHPIVGSAQKQGAFWDRTAKHYNDHRQENKECRNVCSLESKWSDLKKDVAKFFGCYSQVVDAHHSGENEEDTIRRSKELYVVKDPKSKEFQYLGQWVFLKECPRFAICMDNMKQKAAQKSARKQKGKGRTSAQVENEGQHFDSVIDLDDQEADDGRRQTGQFPSGETDVESIDGDERRPLGNKMAKKLRLDENSQKVMAAAQRDMALTSAKRLMLAESWDRKLLFSMKVDDVDPECQEFFRLSRLQELRSAMATLQKNEEAFQRGNASSAAQRTPLPPNAPSAAQRSPEDRQPTDKAFSPGVDAGLPFHLPVEAESP